MADKCTHTDAEHEQAWRQVRTRLIKEVLDYTVDMWRSGQPGALDALDAIVAGWRGLHNQEWVGPEWVDYVAGTDRERVSHVAAYATLALQAYGHTRITVLLSVGDGVSAPVRGLLSLLCDSEDLPRNAVDVATQLIDGFSSRQRQQVGSLAMTHMVACDVSRDEIATLAEKLRARLEAGHDAAPGDEGLPDPDQPPLPTLRHMGNLPVVDPQPTVDAPSSTVE